MYNRSFVGTLPFKGVKYFRLSPSVPGYDPKFESSRRRSRVSSHGRRGVEGDRKIPFMSTRDFRNNKSRKGVGVRTNLPALRTDGRPVSMYFGLKFGVHIGPLLENDKGRVRLEVSIVLADYRYLVNPYLCLVSLRAF